MVLESRTIRPPPDGGVEHVYDENNHGRVTVCGQIIRWVSQVEFIHSGLKLKSKLNQMEKF